METLFDAHYFQLPSQSNIYLSTVIRKSDGNNILLIPILKRKVFSFEYEADNNDTKPVIKEVSFSCIPTGAEMVSIDTINKSETADDFVIGITVIRNSEAGTECYLNLYSNTNYGCSNKLNIENIAQNCENLELEFIPYGLYHVQIPPHLIDNNYEFVWLLSGSDERIHIYRELDNHSHYEISPEDFFPELIEVPSIVFSLDIRYYNQFYRRISCIGCESGYFRCTVVDTINQQMLYDMSRVFDSVITNVSLFTIKSPEISCSEFITSKCDINWLVTEINPKINILLTIPLCNSVVYMNVLESNLENQCVLEGSNDYDVASCSVIADINFDGDKEILLGTYGQEVLIYKYTDECKGWRLIEQISFPNPVFNLHYIDLTQDGVNELIVQTMKGVHIYQHDPRILSTIINRRIQKLLQNESTDNGNQPQSIPSVR